MSLTKLNKLHLDYTRMGRVHHIHMIGIGGAGMGGIAEVLLTLGYAVSGSDLQENTVTRRLFAQGASITFGHNATHIQNCDVVVVSSAITVENPEWVEARKRNIPVIPRAEMLAELMRFRYGIAIAGTHGKTTTTSLIASILAEGGLDPTYVIGGLLNSSGSHARLGDGRYLVAEADESDASFLYLQPMLAIVTNIDADHMETYGGDFAKLRKAFTEFLHHVPFYGQTILCLDDTELRALIPQLSRSVLSYGTCPEAAVRARDVCQSGAQTQFLVDLPNRSDALPITLNMPGLHNVRNALAAIAVAHELGVDDRSIQRSLEQFQGIGRRFQVYKGLRLPAGEVLLIDDYGHHPKELSVTLAAVRAGWPGRRLVLLFQPHRYSRTRDLFADFVAVLQSPDCLLLAEVYSAGEAVLSGADSCALWQAIRRESTLEAKRILDLAALPEFLAKTLQANDILLISGAGSIGMVAGQLMDRFGHDHNPEEKTNDSNA